MENAILNGGLGMSAAYDYRVYDRVWKRVSPDVDPYAEDLTGGESAADALPTSSPPVPAAPAVPVTPAVSVAPVVSAAPAVPVTPAAPSADVGAAGEAGLPGASKDPCCMGTNALDSLEVLEGFLEEELAGRRHCMALAGCLRSQSAVRLMRQAASEKQAAVRELCAAYFLITGRRYAPAATVEHLQFKSLPEALRSCYHQEACNGFNYQRSAEETLDPCLQKLFTRLGEQSYRRSEGIMALLGRLLC